MSCPHIGTTRIFINYRIQKQCYGMMMGQLNLNEKMQGEKAFSLCPLRSLWLSAFFLVEIFRSEPAGEALDLSRSKSLQNASDSGCNRCHEYKEYYLFIGHYSAQRGIIIPTTFPGSSLCRDIMYIEHTS